ncbi:MAG: pyrimidine dimer DNA glycosylase/endonuclease V [Patescibacteria group bacterium]|jgi:hypothetical protein
MRLWSLHPGYLDRQGLLANWREGLLARKVLLGRTKGYRHHPQLQRFSATKNPISYLNAYLYILYQEAARRGYSFSLSKIAGPRSKGKISVSDGQLRYEGEHLRQKLLKRKGSGRLQLSGKRIIPHPSFKIIVGPVADWEKMKI